MTTLGFLKSESRPVEKSKDVRTFKLKELSTICVPTSEELKKYNKSTINSSSTNNTVSSDSSVNPQTEQPAPIEQKIQSIQIPNLLKTEITYHKCRALGEENKEC